MRAAVVLLEGDRICLIERRRAGKLYYLFPGGGIEEGETPQQAAIREAYEELGVHVELQRLLAQLSFKGQQQYFYLARIVGGQFGTGQGEEFLSTADSKHGTYLPMWLPLAEAITVDARPRELCWALLTGELEPDKVLRLSR